MQLNHNWSFDSTKHTHARTHTHTHTHEHTHKNDFSWVFPERVTNVLELEKEWTSLSNLFNKISFNAGKYIMWQMNWRFIKDKKVKSYLSI